MTNAELFQGITKEHVIEALELIDKEGYNPLRKSTTYDLVFHGKAYPPKYVLSLAGFVHNNKFITHDRFSGGEESLAFSFLRSLGFEIKPKEETEHLLKAKSNPDVRGKYTNEEDDMERPEFFNQDDLETLNEFSGKKMDNSLVEMKEGYKKLKDVYQKVEYWAREVQRNAFPEGVISIIRKPTNQANIFESYLWAKLYPTLEHKEWKNLAYTLVISKTEGFVVKVDTVGLNDNDPVRQKFFEYRGDFYTSRVNRFLKPEEIIKYDWDYLITKSCEAIKDLSPHYAVLLRDLSIGNIQETQEQYLNVGKSKPVESSTLNQILFGPPGTGKTFNSINQALSIIENTDIEEINEMSRNAIRLKFEEYSSTGQIKFITFHQSLTYEDFIEGIKPKTDDNVVTYEIENGIFKSLCIDAAFSIAQRLDSGGTAKALDFALLYDQFAASLEETLSRQAEVSIPTKSGGHINAIGVSSQGNIIIKHVEGSREYTISKERLVKLDQEIDNLDEVSNIDSEFRKIIGGSNSSAYWSLLKTIRSLKPDKTGNVKRNYSLSDKLAAINALRKEDYQNTSGKPFVLIIDEINRGNVSQIFGELITLLENDKRLGMDEAIEVVLPYSKQKFGVPPNVYVIGTMNTADRSVEALDTALRRRFSFIEMPPLYDFEEFNEQYGGITLIDLLTKINQRLEKLLSKDHVIGHSYFLAISSLHDLKGVFQRKILPLLQEYFYGDFGKIGLVVGSGFFDDVKESADDMSFFADFNHYDANDLLEKPVYRLREPLNMSDEEFTIALRKLMRRNDQ